ncbi:hypothetical protein MATL_G00056840 [Megalops atlanticus]|uniref:Uncharacterized protein n=1 Tax=Megalops atlanticus TaxID=7932 RepID=A0A9D3T8Z8_MEGAT|nr:hypothetical protein MATL_G00056840 [Megalops atlanticus]
MALILLGTDFQQQREPSRRRRGPRSQARGADPARRAVSKQMTIAGETRHSGRARGQEEPTATAGTSE